MLTPIKKSFAYGAHTVTMETGEIARQATGAVSWPHLAQNIWFSCQSSRERAVPRIATSSAGTCIASTRKSSKAPMPASGPLFSGSPAAEMSMAK